MTKEEMIKLYRDYDKAVYTRLGFTYERKLYSLDVKHIPEEFIRVSAASKDGGMALRVYIPAAAKPELVKKGAVLEGPADLVESAEMNRGHAYEKYITETYAHTTWKRDKIPFYVQGDCVIEGKQVQVKIDSATLTNEKILRNMLKEMGKAA